MPAAVRAARTGQTCRGPAQPGSLVPQGPAGRGLGGEGASQTSPAPVPQRPKSLESGVRWDTGFPRCQEVTAFGASEGPLPTRYCSHGPTEEPLYTGGTRTLITSWFSVFTDRNASWWDGH